MDVVVVGCMKYYGECVVVVGVVVELFYVVYDLVEFGVYEVGELNFGDWF